MAATRTLRFFLDDGLRESAASGSHNFIDRVARLARSNGFEVEYHGDDPESLALAERDDGAYALFHMRHPVGRRGLVFRRVYHYPFWAIEPTAERWNWYVARTAFPADGIDPEEAARFARFWRKKLFGMAQPPQRSEGFLYLPLQGRLTEHRSFQSCAPIDMIESVLKSDSRPVVAALHPKETYDLKDHAALDALASRFGRLTVTVGEMDRYLPACDAVITMNSSVAFNGYFLHKPALLFADVDFHHIAQKAEIGLADALAKLGKTTPEFDRYLFWFWQRMSINAGRPEAEAQIAAALQRAGWPILA